MTLSAHREPPFQESATRLRAQGRSDPESPLSDPGSESISISGRNPEQANSGASMPGAARASERSAGVRFA
jgi:hypothetical protein